MQQKKKNKIYFIYFVVTTKYYNKTNTDFFLYKYLFI